MKRIRMKRSVATARDAYSKGDEVDIADALGTAWIDGGIADDITPDDYEPDPAPESAGEDEADESDEGAPDPPAEDETDVEDADDLDDLKLAELRDLAADLELSTDGKKAELVDRIREHRVAESGDD